MGYTVLIADDAAFMRMMLKDILTKSGYIVQDEAKNGREALEMYRQLRPDVVLMDITMPEMDGLETLVKIKEQDPSAVVIMISAMGQESIVVEAIKSGARDFIVKPFKADRLTQTLRRVIG